MKTADQTEMACKELVVVSPSTSTAACRPTIAAVEAHLDECPYCVNYVVQMKETIDAMGGVSLEALAPERQEEVLEAFRDWRDRSGRDSSS